MNRLCIVAFFALIVSSAAVPAAAQERGRRHGFARLDRDASGTITRDEWRFRPEAFERLDTNRDGVLTRQEVRHRAVQTARRRPAARFDALDRDRDGALSRQEWPRSAAAFERLDTNRDGVLTRQELFAGRPARHGRRVR